MLDKLPSVICQHIGKSVKLLAQFKTHEYCSDLKCQLLNVKLLVLAFCPCLRNSLCNADVPEVNDSWDPAIAGKLF